MRHQTDGAIIREVFADKNATPREKDMAMRLVRLLGTLDAMIEVLESPAPEGERVH